MARLDAPGGMLLIALATASKQLRVVRAAIQWGLPQSDKQVPPGSVPLSPSMQARPAAVTSWFQNDSGDGLLDMSMTQLSHLEILASATSGPSQPWVPPLVLSIRSYLPTSSSSYYQELQSVIDRWEVLTEPAPACHPAFEQLSSKGAQNSNTQVRIPALGAGPIHS